jgi:hypothetical protein
LSRQRSTFNIRLASVGGLPGAQVEQREGIAVRRSEMTGNRMRVLT